MKKLQLSVLSPFEQLLYLYVSTFSFENFLYLASLGDEGTILKAVRKSSLGGGPLGYLPTALFPGVPQFFGGVVTLM